MPHQVCNPCRQILLVTDCQEASELLLAESLLCRDSVEMCLEGRVSPVEHEVSVQVLASPLVAPSPILLVRSCDRTFSVRSVVIIFILVVTGCGTLFRVDALGLRVRHLLRDLVRLLLRHRFLAQLLGVGVVLVGTVPHRPASGLVVHVLLLHRLFIVRDSGQLQVLVVVLRRHVRGLSALIQGVHLLLRMLHLLLRHVKHLETKGVLSAL